MRSTRRPGTTWAEIEGETLESNQVNDVFKRLPNAVISFRTLTNDIIFFVTNLSAA